MLIFLECVAIRSSGSSCGGDASPRKVMLQDELADKQDEILLNELLPEKVLIDVPKDIASM